MSIGETISAAREAQGMTQSDLAGKVFVTRQAVSRWETGATTPGVDMCKLLAAALDVPVTRLLEMPPEPCCQSCGLPLGKETDYGAEADGTKSEEYCTGAIRTGPSPARSRLTLSSNTAPRTWRGRPASPRTRPSPTWPLSCRRSGGGRTRTAGRVRALDDPVPAARWCRSTTPWPARPFTAGPGRRPPVGRRCLRMGV